MAPAISGSGGHNATFAVAVALRHGFDLGEEEAWPILLDYNQRCQPPWSERELRHKLASAGNLQRHSKPRGYLLGTSIPKPPKPPKPIRLLSRPWRQLLSEVTGSQKLHANPCVAPPLAGVDIVETQVPNAVVEDGGEGTVTGALDEAREAFLALLRRGGRLRLDGEKLIVVWNGPRDDVLATRLRAAKPVLHQMLRPLIDPTGVAAELFDAIVIESQQEAEASTEEEWTLERRLAKCAEVLALRDGEGRVGYTRSQIDSLLIGLRTYHGQPGADAMLDKLAEARKSALSWSDMASRR